MLVVYKRVKGFPEYKVGSDGSVWSYKRAHNNGGKPYKLKPSPMKHYGHMTVNLSKPRGTGGSKKLRLVHQLVLEAFVGPCPAGMECRHKDGNPANNRLTNLEWNTHAVNMADMNGHGTSHEGERSPLAKLTETQVIAIRRLHQKGLIKSQRELGRKYGVHQNTISAIVRRKIWTHI